MGFFELGAKDALKSALTAENRDALGQSTIPDFQIILRSAQSTQSIRDLNAENANKLIKVPGIVITSSKTKPRTTLVCIRCTKCQSVKVH
jgi:DNA replicative helicase MCM subunit Mcm2 (Cdc46/Mcm family)